MNAACRLGAVQIGEGSGYFQDPMIAPRRQFHRVCRAAEKGYTCLIQRGYLG